jgi:Fic family protein
LTNNFDQILFSALENYVLTSNYEEFKNTVEAELAIMSDEILFKFTDTTEQIESVDGVMQSKFAEMYKYFSFSEDGLVIGSGDRTIHTPAKHEQLPELMEKWFAYCETDGTDLLIRSFVAHFYFVYIHPFCDGNGRTARILNASQLYHGGYKKMRSLPLTNSINNRLNGYYNSLSDSEIVQGDSSLGEADKGWLDLSPFVYYMLDMFDHCLTDASLSKNVLTASEQKILERMNRAGIRAEITTKKAAGILHRSENATRSVFKNFVKKGYLSVDTSNATHIYRLQQHFADQ